MPGGIYNSSNTRVAPVFTALRDCAGDWVAHLLALAEGNPAASRPSAEDLTYLHGHWGDEELSAPPPASLLSWMVRHPDRLKKNSSTNPDRQKLLAGDTTAIERALQQLTSKPADRAWYVLEGPTVADAWIETPGALIVVEGKRTEAGPTTDTTWLAGRHQIWRHIDAAWEKRGERRVFGLFTVEGLNGTPEVPPLWLKAVTHAVSEAALASSFPHREPSERSAIAGCLLGVTTWQRVVQAFALPSSVLLSQVPTRT